MVNTTDVTIKITQMFLKRLRNFIDQEIHIKLQGDDNGVLYILKEVQKDFVVVGYGESQRFIPTGKIIFIQIGDYPKESFL